VLKPSSGLVKPEIIVGDYELDTGHYKGIPAAEVSELKAFLKDAVPYLPGAVQAAKLLQRRLEGTKRLKREEAAEVFTPTIQLTRFFLDDVQYHLRFTWDGIIFLDRDYSVDVAAQEAGGLNSSVVRLYQPVGELRRRKPEGADKDE